MDNAFYRSRVTLCVGLLAILVLVPNLVSARLFPKYNFEVAFTLAVKKENDGGLVGDRGGRAVKDIQVIESKADYGAWRFVVSGASATGTSTYIVLRGVGQIENFGTYARYLFYMPYAPAGKNLIPYIREDGDMRRYAKYLAEGDKDVKGQLTLEEGQVAIESVFEYGSSHDNGIRDQLRDYLKTTRDIIADYYPAVIEAKKKRYKELEKARSSISTTPI